MPFTLLLRGAAWVNPQTALHTHGMHTTCGGGQDLQYSAAVSDWERVGKC